MTNYKTKIQTLNSVQFSCNFPCELVHSPPNRDENRPAKLSDADALGSKADDRVGLEVMVEGVVEAGVEAGVDTATPEGYQSSA